MKELVILGTAAGGAAWFLNWSGLTALAAMRGAAARATHGPMAIDWLVVRLAVGAARRRPWGGTPAALVLEASARVVDVLDARSGDLQARVEAPLAKAAIRRGATWTRPVVEVRRADLPPGLVRLRFEPRSDASPARPAAMRPAGNPMPTATTLAEMATPVAASKASEARTRHAGATLAGVGARGLPDDRRTTSSERTVRRALLRLQDADGHAREVEVREGQWSVGRSTVNDITLQDPEVSREAVRVVVAYEGVWIEAASTSDAIRLNARSIRGRERIGDGDRIWLSRRAWLDVVQSGGPAA